MRRAIQLVLILIYLYLQAEITYSLILGIDNYHFIVVHFQKYGISTALSISSKYIIILSCCVLMMVNVLTGMIKENRKEINLEDHLINDR